MKFASLFTGIGGFDLGLERAGMECVVQVEMDKNCNQILEKHWPDVRGYEDVKEVKGENLGAVELVCGGFPCQDLSVAGNRAGLRGERSGLWWEFHRLLSEARPQWCLIENVPGLLSSNDGKDMGTILWHLGELGYGWAYRVLDAQYFGLAQRRKRVFIVGCIGDAARAAEVLFEPESSAGDTPTRREAGGRTSRTLRGSITRSSEFDPDYGLTTYRMEAFGQYSEDGSASAMKSRDYKDSTDLVVAKPLLAKKGYRANPSDDNCVTHTLRAEGAGASEDGSGRGTPLVVRMREGKDGGGKGPLVSENQSLTLAQNNDQVVAEPIRTAQTGSNGKGWGHDTSYALDGANGQAVGGTMGVRRLTPTECCRLQGFPDTWVDGLSDGAKYRALGNAVAVPVITWIGKRIVEASRG